MSLKKKKKRKSILIQQELDKDPGKNVFDFNKANEYKKATRIVLFCVLFTGAIVAQLSTTYSLYIQDSFPDWGVQGVSLLFALNSFLVVILEAPIGGFLNDCNKVLMVGIGAFFIGIGMGLLSISAVFLFAVFACFIYTIGEMIFFSMAQLVCYQKSDEQKKGQSLGAYRMAYASSRFVGPTVGGIIYQYLGGQVLWGLSGLIGIVCLGLCYHFRKYY